MPSCGYNFTNITDFRCSVAKELSKVKRDTIQLAREMFRKRYRDMKGTGWKESGSVCKKRGMLFCHNNKRWDYKLVDGASGEDWAVTRWDRDNRKIT